MRRIVSVLVLVLLAVPVAAAAQEDDGPPPGAMLIILDASGSMNTVDADGVPFIDKAKAAVLQLIDALPDGMQVGLRVYGHREPNTDPVVGCRDTELIAPVAPLDRDAIREAVDGIEASGFTPIGLSLTQAAADLPETGPRSIVLISDGEDTCAPPDPCRIAEELYGEAFDVRIESVGFLVGTGSAAEQQLRCIAEVTGGGYSTVEDANALVAALEGVADTLADWRPPLTLNGALMQLEAPEIPIAAKSDWVTDEPGRIGRTEVGSIIMPGETRWWRVDLWEWESFWVFGELGLPPGQDLGGSVEVVILDGDGNRVDAPIPGLEAPTIGAGLQGIQGLPAAGTYLIGMHWDAPTEVVLGSLHMTIEVLNDPMRYLARTEIDGALDPTDAAQLELATNQENGPRWRGRQFRTALASGETRWFRLDMERGDIMNVHALFPGDRWVGDGVSGEFSIVLTDEGGNPVGQAFDEWPQMTQGFGGERHQATVSATTSLVGDPAPETVLIGLRWDAEPGHDSEVRFEVETWFDAQRKEMADQMEAEANRPPAADDDDATVGSTEPTGTESSTTTTDVLAADDLGDGDDGPPAAVFITIGIAVLTTAIAVPLAMRHSRSR